MSLERLLVVIAALLVLGPCSAPDQSAESVEASISDATDRQLNERDLLAQETMAQGTEALADFAWMQLILTAVGTITLIYTLRNNARAMSQTDRALGMAQDNANRELRAYLTIDSPKVISNANGVTRISVRITNRGKTPARKVTCYFGCSFGPAIEAQEIDPDWGTRMIPLRDFGPDEIGNAWLIMGEDGLGRLKEVKADINLRVLLWLTVAYNDAFEQAQWVRYSAFLGGPDLSLDRDNPAFLGGS